MYISVNKADQDSNRLPRFGTVILNRRNVHFDFPRIGGLVIRWFVIRAAIQTLNIKNHNFIEVAIKQIFKEIIYIYIYIYIYMVVCVFPFVLYGSAKNLVPPCAGCPLDPCAVCPLDPCAGYLVPATCLGWISMESLRNENGDFLFGFYMVFKGFSLIPAFSVTLNTSGDSKAWPTWCKLQRFRPTIVAPLAQNCYRLNSEAIFFQTPLAQNHIF